MHPSGRRSPSAHFLARCKTLVATEAAKPGHGIPAQMTLQTACRSPFLGVLQGAFRERGGSAVAPTPRHDVLTLSAGQIRDERQAAQLAQHA